MKFDSISKRKEKKTYVHDKKPVSLLKWPHRNDFQYWSKGNLSYKNKKCVFFLFIVPVKLNHFFSFLIFVF